MVATTSVPEALGLRLITIGPPELASNAIKRVISVQVEHYHVPENDTILNGEHVTRLPQ